MKHVFIVICFLLLNAGNAQTTQDSVVVTKDTVIKVKSKKDHGPRNAAILSALIPGAGQIYNRKWWKPPVVWAAMGGVGYFFMQQQSLFIEFRNDVRASAEGRTADVKNNKYDTDQLNSQKIVYRKNRDRLGFGLIALYAIQIIDANVDAHLKTFDVSDDLSLQVSAKPLLSGTAIGGGISLKLNFK